MVIFGATNLIAVASLVLFITTIALFLQRCRLRTVGLLLIIALIAKEYIFARYRIQPVKLDFGQLNVFISEIRVFVTFGLEELHGIMNINLFLLLLLAYTAVKLARFSPKNVTLFSNIFTFIHKSSFEAVTSVMVVKSANKLIHKFNC